ARRVDTADALPDIVAGLGVDLVERAHRRTSVADVAGNLHGIEDFLVAGAPADIATKTLLDFLAVSERIGAQRGGCRHHHARNAVAALAGPDLVEGLLQEREFTGT